MSIFLQILFATIIVSCISLIGVFTLAVRKEALEKVLILILGFAAGGLMGSAFLHLLPEAVESSVSVQNVFAYTLIGFCFFFLMERYFYWRHCHEDACDVHAFTYLSLVGDSIHNFLDGLLIAASFMTNTALGISTTIAVIIHEIPQEMGDFSILIYGGFKTSKALLFNFMTALTAVAGAVLGYFLLEKMGSLSSLLVPFTAGGFIYIASSDLIPEIHKHKHNNRANLSFLMFIAGLVLMYVLKMSLHTV